MRKIYNNECRKMDIEEQDGRERIRKEYFKLRNRGLCDNNASSHGHGIKSSSSKHSYFLRAKIPGFQVSNHNDGGASLSSFLSSKPSTGECSTPTEEEDLANCLVMLSNNKSSSDHTKDKDKEIAMEKGMFQCKACKKVFNSHQALGGHRASHKKVKGCFASKLDGLNEDDEDEEINEGGGEEEPPSEFDPTRKRMKVHECSVCRRVFSSGQALGGHKRCHWLTTTSSDNAFIPSFQYHHHHHHNPALLITKHDSCQLDLNLNLPPPPQNDQEINKTSTRLCLHQWTNQNQQKIDKEVIDKNGENGCGMKLRKLSDLREVNMDGGWLQMGIASNTTQMR